MQEVPEGRSKVGQRILLLVAEEVGGSDRVTIGSGESDPSCAATTRGTRGSMVTVRWSEGV